MNNVYLVNEKNFALGGKTKAVEENKEIRRSLKKKIVSPYHFLHAFDEEKADSNYIIKIIPVDDTKQKKEWLEKGLVEICKEKKIIEKDDGKFRLKFFSSPTIPEAREQVIEFIKYLSMELYAKNVRDFDELCNITDYMKAKLFIYFSPRGYFSEDEEEEFETASYIFGQKLDAIPDMFVVKGYDKVGFNNKEFISNIIKKGMNIDEYLRWNREYSLIPMVSDDILNTLKKNEIESKFI